MSKLRRENLEIFNVSAYEFLSQKVVRYGLFGKWEEGAHNENLKI